MFNFQRSGFLTSSLVLVSEALVVATAGPMKLTEAQFMAQNQAAMSKMMADMRTTNAPGGYVAPFGPRDAGEPRTSWP